MGLMLTYVAKAGLWEGWLCYDWVICRGYIGNTRDGRSKTSAQLAAGRCCCWGVEAVQKEPELVGQRVGSLSNDGTKDRCYAPRPWRFGVK